MIHLQRIVVGAATSFLVISLLYGVTQAMVLVGLAVICTVGIGLIPILFVSWLVGWVLIEAWRSFNRPRTPSASLNPPAPPSAS